MKMADRDTTLPERPQRIRSESLLDNVLWSQESLLLSKFVDQYQLPQIVKVDEGYYGAHDESSLSTGQILKIHYTRSSKRVKAKDRGGNEVYIPLNTSHRVVLKPKNCRVVYPSVADLAHSRPIPKYVEITQGYYNVDSSDSQELSVEPGEKLEVGAIEILNIRGHRRKYMTFISFNGVEVKLPFNCMAGFKPFDDVDDHTLPEIIANHPLPQFVQFVADQRDQPIEGDKGNALTRLGVLKLEQIYDEELIIASCGYNGSCVVFSIPRSLSITVKIATGSLRSDPIYDEICATYNNFSDLETKIIEASETDVFCGPSGLTEFDYKCRTSGTLQSGNQKLEQAQHNPSSQHYMTCWNEPLALEREKVIQPLTILTLSDDSVGRSYEMDTATQSSMGSTETFDSRSSNVDVDPYSSKGEADDELEYDCVNLAFPLAGGTKQKQLSLLTTQEKMTFRGSSNNRYGQLLNCKTDTTKESNFVKNGDAVGGTNEDCAPIVTVTPMAPAFDSQVMIEQAEVVVNAANDSCDQNKNTARAKELEKRHSDSTSDTDDSSKLQNRGSLWSNFGPIESGNLSSTSDSYVYSRTKQERSARSSDAKNRSQSVGPQSTNLIYLDENRNSKNDKGRSFSNPLIAETAPTGDFKFSTDLSGLTIDQVVRSLHRLNLGHLEDTFRHNQINGGLLVCLDDESLRDLKLTSFERRKILTFVHGWRPDK